jgi:propanol-preferring alcohol dehydrogenase
VVADERFCLALEPGHGDVEVAPLLCAGLIGYRALRMTGDAERLGLYGFGASAHIVCQVARHQGRRVFALTRSGDAEGQEFARELGAEWAGDVAEGPPEELDAAIIFAPAGELVPAALEALDKGATLVLGGIHMSPIPALEYALLYGERALRTTANNTREDGRQFLIEAARIPVRAHVRTFPLAEVNEALIALKHDAIRGAGVLMVAPGG